MRRNLKLAFLKGGGEPIEFTPETAITIGRAMECVMRLNDPHVSRRHATLHCVDDNWTFIDNGSRHGTRINGTPLLAQEPCVLAHGDQLTIHPYVLRVDLGGEAMTLVQLTAHDSGNGIKLIEPDELANLAGRRLNVLLDVASKLQEASDEKSMALIAVKALLLGTGFGRATLLRGHDDSLYEMLASVTQSNQGDVQARMSSTLLRAAAAGKPVRLDQDAGMNLSESMINQGVTAALCVPILLDSSVEGFLYLDSTSGLKSNNDDAAFAKALGQFVGMGLGEIRRRDLAQRQLHIQTELAAAHAVQRRLMPADQGCMGPWRWKLYSEPGRVVAGDIVGAGESDQGFWFFLGDVAGKGASAGMLMASIQAHLAGELERGNSIAQAMNATNSYVRRHRSQAEFATLMAMRLSSDGRLMSMVDAGHAMGAIVRAGAPAIQLQCNGGPPIGVVDEEYEFSELQLQLGDRLLLFSDGVCEQRNADGEELGMQRVFECVADSRNEHEDVERVMQLLRAHAAGAPFTDDVSVASLAYGIGQTRSPV